MNIGKQIKLYRELMGLTQEQLAKKAKITQEYLSGIESGKKDPVLSVLTKIARAMKVTLTIN